MRRLTQLVALGVLCTLWPALALGQTVRKETVIWDFVNGLRVRGVPIGAAGASGADQVFVSDSPGQGTWRTLPHAPGGIGYDNTTNTFQAVTVGVSSGLVSTMQLSDGASGFAPYLGTLCEPGLVMRGLTAIGKADCDINGGIAPATVQAILNTHVLLDRTESIFPNGIALGALSSGVLLSTVTDGVASLATLPAPTGALVGTTAIQTLRNKRIIPRSCLLPIDDATLTINVDDCEVAVLSDLLQDTQFMTPEGTAEEGDTLRMRVHATVPRAITWAAGWSPLGGAPLPAVLVGDAVWYFQYNASLGWVFLLNSKFIDALLVSGVTPGTYNCPRDLAVGMDGRITSLVEGECAGGGGGSATAAGVAGDVQFKGTGSNLAAASNGGFTFDSGNQTLGLQNMQTASAGGYYSFTDVYGNLGYLWGPQMSAPRVWSLPDRTGELATVAGALTPGKQLAFLNGHIVASAEDIGAGSGGDALTTDPLSQFAATTSAQLAGVLSDENGSGKAIFAAGNLAITTGKTLTASNTLTLTGTDSASVAFGAGGTVVYVGGATGTLQLPVAAIKLPSSNPATPDVGETNTRLLFDASTSECAIWEFVLPADYSSTPVLKLKYSMTSATSGSLNFDVSVMAVTAGDSADINTESYDTAVACDDGTVPGTAGHLAEISCSLTSVDSWAANDLVKLRVCRDIGDTATGDAELVRLTLQYAK